MRRFWLDLLTYLSAAAVVVALVRGDYLRWPQVHDVSALLTSTLFLLGGFATTVMAWRSALQASGVTIGLSDATASVGLSVFGKYLPGKVWLILGMAGRVAALHPIAINDAVAAATRLQVVSLWLGLIVGLPALSVMRIPVLGVLGVLAMMALVSAVLSQRRVRAGIAARWPLAARALSYVWPRDRPLSVDLVLWLALTWVVWGVGFGALCHALTGQSWPWPVYMVFPMATVAGLLVLIAPGGIGAREGVLALSLVGLGMPIADATAIAVFSRLWFLFAEASTFIAGLWASRYSVQRSRLL